MIAMCLGQNSTHKMIYNQANNFLLRHTGDPDQTSVAGLAHGFREGGLHREAPAPPQRNTRPLRVRRGTQVGTLT